MAYSLQLYKVQVTRAAWTFDIITYWEEASRQASSWLNHILYTTRNFPGRKSSQLCGNLKFYHKTFMVAVMDIRVMPVIEIIWHEIFPV